MTGKSSVGPIVATVEKSLHPLHSIEAPIASKSTLLYNEILLDGIRWIKEKKILDGTSVNFAVDLSPTSSGSRILQMQARLPLNSDGKWQVTTITFPLSQLLQGDHITLTKEVDAALKVPMRCVNLIGSMIQMMTQTGDQYIYCVLDN